MNLALALMLLALGVQAEPEEERAPDPEKYVGGILAGAVWEEDSRGGPDLDGYRIGFTAVSEKENSRIGHTGTFYFEWKDSRRQEIAEAGAELAYPYFRFKRVSIGPRFRLAIQERADAPHRGTDGLFGVGFDLGFWITERVQIAVLADRGMGFESGTRNSYSLDVRILMWGK